MTHVTSVPAWHFCSTVSASVPWLILTRQISDSCFTSTMTKFFRVWSFLPGANMTRQPCGFSANSLKLSRIILFVPSISFMLKFEPSFVFDFREQAELISDDVV